MTTFADTHLFTAKFFVFGASLP